MPGGSFMKKVFIFAALLAMAAFGFSGVAKADSFTAGGVVYTFTNLGSDGGSGFLVQLTIDASAPTASGSLDTFAVQFFSNGTSATNASIQSGPSGWSVVGFGNVNQCGTGNLPFICSQGPAITITSGQDSGTYTFVFDVTISGSPDLGDVQAFQGQGGLAISQNIDIGGPPTNTPEPASMLLLGLGLAGAPFLRRRKS
jgi:hypothetical protein